MLGDSVDKWNAVVAWQFGGDERDTQKFGREITGREAKMSYDALGCGWVSISKEALTFLDLGDEPRIKREGVDTGLYNGDCWQASMTKNEDIIGKKEVSDITIFSFPVMFELLLLGLSK